jgi:AraC-like DNA-binding protein
MPRPVYDEDIADAFTAKRVSGLARPLLPTHYHPCYEVFVCCSEAMAFVINGQLFQITHGDLILFTDQDLHQALPPQAQPYERLVIIFQPDLARAMSTPQTNLLACFHDSDIQDRILHLDPLQLHGLEAIIASDDALRKQPDAYGQDVRKRLLLADLLLDLNRWFGQRRPSRASGTPAGAIEGVITYIHQHLAESLKLSDLAGHFRCSGNRLNERFKDYTGKSIHRYLIDCRIGMARRFLRTGMPVTDTAMACGFANLSHFCRTFRQVTGTTPSQYSRT